MPVMTTLVTVEPEPIFTAHQDRRYLPGIPHLLKGLLVHVVGGGTEALYQ